MSEDYEVLFLTFWLENVKPHFFCIFSIDKFVEPGTKFNEFKSPMFKSFLNRK